MATTRRTRIVVAINPTASFGASPDVGPAVVRTLRASGHDVTSLTEPDVEQLEASARRALASRPDALVVVGGDGMVNLGANLLAGSTVPLGIIPSGTGNDVARGLGIPHDDTEAAIRMLDASLQSGPRAIDAMRLRWTEAGTGASRERRVVGTVNAGFDARVNERANAMRFPKGPRRYTLAILAELVRLHPVRYRLTVDGAERTVSANLVTVANNVSFGGGMLATPEAELDDGELDLFVVRPLSRINFLRIFPRIFTGAHVGHPSVSIERVRRVRIDADEPIVAYGDGERIAPLPLEAEVVPGALRVLAPWP